MLADAIVHAASILAPAAERDEFVREWRAELAWAAAGRGRPELARRACGAFVHALWLRKEQWSLDMLWQDVRFAARMLLARPTFTAVAVLTLALGIGANAAIFSLVHGVLLKPLPFKEPHRLVQIWETNPLRNWTDATASPANLLDWKQRNTSFEDIAYYPGKDDRTPMFTNGTATGDAEPERLKGVQVSANFFRVLGVAPALGRDFEEAEQQAGRGRVVILSDALWRARYRGDPAIVGRDITLNTRPYQVIGVMPPDVRFPSPEVQMWTPFTMDDSTAQLRRPHYLRPIARLKPGVTIEQARGELVRIAADLEKQYPDTNTQMSVGLGPLQEFVVGGVRRPLLVFLGAVALVLLVACANLANLLLARASGRRREFAVRAALGGAGWRLARQLLVESALLAACGGILGTVLARWAIGAVVGTSSADMPRLEEVSLDGRVVLFVAAVTGVTALLFGLAPAWQAARADVAALRDGTRTTGGGALMRRLLVIGQVAASVALVACAGLLLRSFERLQSVPPGFDPEHAVSFRVNLPGAKYGEDPKAIAFFEQFIARLRAMPGVAAAGGSTVIGLAGQGWTGDLFVDGRPGFWGRELRHKTITPGYFAAMGLPLLRGRDLADADTATAQPVVVVNEALVRSYFEDEDPLGKRIFFGKPRPGRPAPPLYTIVGVVRDEKQNGLGDRVAPEVYDTYAQSATLGMTIVVRSETLPAASLVPAARHELATLDNGLAMFDVKTLRDVVSESVARQRFTTWIVAVFAGLALLIAAVGVYGVVSYSVSGRTREIGVRLALGATRGNVVGLVLAETFSLVGLGTAGGLVLCIFASRAIRTLLFETAPTDLVTYATVVGVLAGVGLIASLVPVRRAISVDPNVALRYE